jgi:hypothetical protein
MAEVNMQEEVSLDESLCKDVLIADLELKMFELSVADANRKIQEQFNQLRQVHEQALTALAAAAGIERDVLIAEYEVNLKSAKARRAQKGSENGAEENA